MTKEEAIRILSTRDSHGMVTGYAGGVKEAIDKGLEALKQEPCPYWDYGLNTCRHANIGALATKPCEDAVSREDALEATDEVDWETNYERLQMIKALQDLPSVQPKSSWIPVSEKLPDMGKYVLCSVNKIYESDLEVVITQFRNEGWWTDGRINAWMPLPEPYKADKKGEE